MKQGKVSSILAMVLLSATILTSCGKETSKKPTEEGTKISTSQQELQSESETSSQSKTEAKSESSGSEEALESSEAESKNGSESESKSESLATERQEEVTLNISFAASLTDVSKELEKEFKLKYPNIKLLFNFGSSGKLQQQIEQGAEVDLFLSAGKKQVDALVEQDLVDSKDSKDLLENKLVLIVPKDSDKNITDFADLASSKVEKIAIGDKNVPVGQYTEEACKSLGIWEEVSKKASLGSDVRTVLAWTEQAAADCGVVYATDAAISKEVKVVAEAPEGSHKPVIYPLAIIKASSHIKESGLFADFLQSDEAASIFEKYGFKMVK